MSHDIEKLAEHALELVNQGWSREAAINFVIWDACEEPGRDLSALIRELMREMQSAL